MIDWMIVTLVVSLLLYGALAYGAGLWVGSRKSNEDEDVVKFRHKSFEPKFSPIQEAPLPEPGSRVSAARMYRVRRSSMKV